MISFMFFNLLVEIFIKQLKLLSTLQLSNHTYRHMQLHMCIQTYYLYIVTFNIYIYNKQSNTHTYISSFVIMFLIYYINIYTYIHIHTNLRNINSMRKQRISRHYGAVYGQWLEKKEIGTLLGLIIGQEKGTGT